MNFDLFYLCLGTVTGFLSSEQHKNAVIQAIKDRRFYRGYVTVLRDYLDEILTATED